SRAQRPSGGSPHRGRGRRGDTPVGGGHGRAGPGADRAGARADQAQRRDPDGTQQGGRLATVVPDQGRVPAPQPGAAGRAQSTLSRGQPSRVHRGGEGGRGRPPGSWRLRHLRRAASIATRARRRRSGERGTTINNATSTSPRRTGRGEVYSWLRPSSPPSRTPGARSGWS